MLLVEDSPTDVFVIKEVLDACAVDLRVLVAKDGHEALQVLRGLPAEDCPALILLDLNIPKVNGLEVLRQVRAGSNCQETPVVIVSSSRADEDRGTAERLGANAYFQKPADLQSYTQLGMIVERMLGHTGAGS